MIISRCILVLFVAGFLSTELYGEVIYAKTDSVKVKKKYSFLYGFDRPYIAPRNPNDTVKKKRDLKHINVFSGSIGFNTGRLVYYDPAKQAKKFTLNAAFVGTLNIRLYKELTLSGSFFAIPLRDNLPPWIADFYYSVKWANWRPHTFSFGYDNYADNRYTDSWTDFYKKLMVGQFYVSYNHNLPKKWIDKIRIDPTTNFNIAYMVRYSIWYRDTNNVYYTDKGGKAVFVLAMRYTIARRCYIEAAAYAYVKPKQTKLPWDPDFTYGFGYADWRPWRVSVTYGNWIANRWPGKKKELAHYNFFDGNFSINFNYAW